MVSWQLTWLKGRFSLNSNHKNHCQFPLSWHLPFRNIPCIRPPLLLQREREREEGWGGGGGGGAFHGDKNKQANKSPKLRKSEMVIRIACLRGESARSQPLSSLGYAYIMRDRGLTRRHDGQIVSMFLQIPRMISSVSNIHSPLVCLRDRERRYGTNMGFVSACV